MTPRSRFDMTAGKRQRPGAGPAGQQAATSAPGLTGSPDAMRVTGGGEHG
jgi:hypothetical protein